MREGLGEHRHPSYAAVHVPSLAIVPVGKAHPFLIPGLADDKRRAIDAFYAENFYPWIMARSHAFLAEAPHPTVVELDTSNHSIFVAKEAETASTILEWLETH
jgi:hypothetical protein